MTRWLAARATDAPDNFLHLLRLEAERAWAAGDFRAAVLAFDAALREVAGRQRPWHRALIAERAGRFFYLASGVDHTGSDLLRPGPPRVRCLGRATAKVAPAGLGPPLPCGHHPMRPPAAGDRPPVFPGVAPRLPDRNNRPDLLGILSASQALSSETSIDRLHARVAEVLGR